MSNFMMTGDFFALSYLLCGVLYILGVKGLSSPKTARFGNALSMVGMALAVVITFFHPQVNALWWIVVPIALGALVGLPLASKVKLTALPQLVALFNGFVGLAATLVAVGMYLLHTPTAVADLAEIGIGSLIGAVTFTGSVVAFAKLQGIMSGTPIVFSAQRLVNGAVLLASFALLGVFMATGQALWLWLSLALALAWGVMFLLPIGGADMPVVIAVLNALSGWATTATGFSLDNVLLILTGTLVGASGAILSVVMCRAMNRSLSNVLLGGFGEEAEVEGGTSLEGKVVKQAAVADMSFMLENSQQVIVVPGYGMAVAQAQQAVKEVMLALEEQSINVRFAIHPVAGRMPGHMNVLLAEADVPYEQVVALEDINHEFATADAVIVLGANDVVNPDAKQKPGSPIYGMPILEAYKAKQVFVVKRSLRSGYAGVENPLFYMENTSMVLGDAKSVMEKLANSLRG